MKIDLGNKVALVADGSSAIGKAICLQLAESGARVSCLTSSAETESECQKYFSDKGFDVTIYRADIGNFAECEKLIAEIEQAGAMVDIMINNTDFNYSGNFNEMSVQQWQDSIHINLDSVYNLCRQISEKMSERHYGRIINISSVYAKKGVSGRSAYAAPKSGLHGFTMALSQELARKGVTVNTVSPGHIKTEKEEELSQADTNEIIAGIPASRMGEANEVASLVDFLCSEQASFITGTDIAINGGQHIY